MSAAAATPLSGRQRQPSAHSAIRARGARHLGDRREPRQPLERQQAQRQHRRRPQRAEARAARSHANAGLEHAPAQQAREERQREERRRVERKEDDAVPVQLDVGRLQEVLGRRRERRVGRTRTPAYGRFGRRRCVRRRRGSAQRWVQRRARRQLERRRRDGPRGGRRRAWRSPVAARARLTSRPSSAGRRRRGRGRGEPSPGPTIRRRPTNFVRRPARHAIIAEAGGEPAPRRLACRAAALVPAPDAAPEREERPSRWASYDVQLPRRSRA